jgi:hypothetical protein
MPEYASSGSRFLVGVWVGRFWCLWDQLLSVWMFLVYFKVYSVESGKAGVIVYFIEVYMLLLAGPYIVHVWSISKSSLSVSFWVQKWYQGFRRTGYFCLLCGVGCSCVWGMGWFVWCWNLTCVKRRTRIIEVFLCFLSVDEVLPCLCLEVSVHWRKSARWT